MAKRKPQIRMRSYGIYTKWNRDSKDLPRLIGVTTEVPATVDIEFGFIVNVRGGKNEQLDFCIDHPGILDASGKRRRPFDGTEWIKTNDWNFYLGDTIWDPISDKLGTWHMSLSVGDGLSVEKTFEVVDPAARDNDRNERGQ